MVSYRLIREILAHAIEEQDKAHEYEIDEDDFIFSCELFKSPALTRAELAELRRQNYIYYPRPGFFVPCQRAYRWRREIIVQVLSYLGLSVITPVLVTLATLWISGQL